MSRLDVVRLVAGREIGDRARSKPFQLSSAISVLMILVIAILPGLLADDGPTTYDVAVDDPALVERLDAVAAALEDEVVIEARTVEGVAEARALVRDGAVDAAVAGGSILVDESLDDRLGFIVQTAAVEVPLPEPLPVEALDPVDEEDEQREALVFVGTLLLYGQLLGFGYWVAAGVVEEKSSRVVELLLAKASPGTVLTGKVLGIGVMGFVQLVGTIAVGLVAALASGSLDAPPGLAGLVAQVLAWFVLGFAFYSCLFAVGGALASRSEELQTTTGPLSVVVVLAFFAAMFAGGDPGGTVARVTTFLPPTAPLVLPIRASAGELPLWEAVLAVAIVLVAIVAVIRLAGRAYAGAALHVRGQLKLRQALAGRR